MRPPFPYYGGKTRLAPWVASLMPRHRVYVEPFAGSAAVLFAKPRVQHEVVNDVDGNVVTFLRMLRDRPEELMLACALTPYARDEFYAADLLDELDDLERARRWWVRSNQSFAKVATRATGWARTVERASSPAISQLSRLGRLGDAAARLAGVTIENTDARKVVEFYATAEAVVYADPPYLISTRSALAKRQRTGDYVHEYSSDDEHRALAEVLRATPATVLLSGYASELYDEELYPDWHRLERRSRRGRNVDGVEVIWSNRRLAEARLFD